jgi:hypothetical protein
VCIASRMPRRLSRVVLSKVTTWLMFTTQSRSRPAVPAARTTLPGAADSRRFDVIVATVTVFMREGLNASAETTRTGRRQTGAEPCRGPRRFGARGSSLLLRSLRAASTGCGDARSCTRASAGIPAAEWQRSSSNDRLEPPRNGAEGAEFHQNLDTSVTRLCPPAQPVKAGLTLLTQKWSGARDLNPGPHGPEPAVSRVLPCPAGSSSVLLYSMSPAVVSFCFLPCPPGSANA